MQPPATTRWLISPSEFARRLMDYAFPRSDSANIKRELHEWDFRSSDFLPWTYSGFVCPSDCMPCYEYATEGALLYADVTGTAEHKQLVERFRATEVLSADQKELVKRQQRGTVDSLVAMYKALRAQREDTQGHDQDVGDADAEYERMERIIHQEGAYIEPNVVKFILGCRTQTQKAAVLDLYSGEGSVKHPRPTLMLISMFDEAKAARYTESSGYLVAYDFLTNRVIIKHWTSSLDHHPLGDPWFEKPADDGVCYLGSPSNLVERIVNRRGLMPDRPGYCFSLVTRLLAGQWLLKYMALPGLAIATVANSSKPEEISRASAQNDARYDALKAAVSRHAAELEALDVPGVDRDPDGNKLDTNYRQGRSDVHCVYGGVLDIFETWEVALQETAAGERAANKDKVAKNLAKFYDGVTRAARTLFADPAADFNFE